MAGSVKRKPGRPKGAVNKNGYHIVRAIRSSLDEALGLLDAKGTPLSDILARELNDNPAQTLAAISRFLPKEIDVAVTPGGTYLDALKHVQVALETKTIDALPERKPDIIECDINTAVNSKNTESE